MSTLDKFIEKGEQIGILKGEQIGIQKGKNEKTIETVLKAYDNGISIPLIANISSIKEEEVINILKQKGKG